MSCVSIEIVDTARRDPRLYSVFHDHVFVLLCCFFVQHRVTLRDFSREFVFVPLRTVYGVYSTLLWELLIAFARVEEFTPCALQIESLNATLDPWTMYDL